MKYPSYVNMARSVLAKRCAEGSPLTTQAELMEALSLLPEEKNQVYAAIRQLKRRGELVAEGKGFRYMPEAAPETLFDRVYRVIRAFRGGFTVAEIASIAESNPDRTRSIIETLTANAYLNESGRKGLLKVWVATQKCRDAPTPPRLNYGHGALMQERRAVTKLVEIYMTATDLSGAGTSANIRECLDILNRRFAKKEVENDS